MIAELKEKLSGEVAKLRYELNVTLPQEIRKAVEHGDLRENSEYKAALERQRFVQARLGQLMQRLSKLSDIDVTQIPTDRVGLGSRVTVEDPATEIRETYELVFGDGGELQDGQVSMSSPIGLALQNKSVGESAVLKLPTCTRRLKIVELLTTRHGRWPRPTGLRPIRSRAHQPHLLKTPLARAWSRALLSAKVELGSLNY